jgi:hypothetical protein
MRRSQKLALQRMPVASSAAAARAGSAKAKAAGDGGSLGALLQSPGACRRQGLRRSWSDIQRRKQPASADQEQVSALTPQPNYGPQCSCHCNPQPQRRERPRPCPPERQAERQEGGGVRAHDRQQRRAFAVRRQMPAARGRPCQRQLVPQNELEDRARVRPRQQQCRGRARRGGGSGVRERCGGGAATGRGVEDVRREVPIGCADAGPAATWGGEGRAPHKTLQAGVCFASSFCSFTPVSLKASHCALALSWSPRHLAICAAPFDGGGRIGCPRKAAGRHGRARPVSKRRCQAAGGRRPRVPEARGADDRQLVLAANQQRRPRRGRVQPPDRQAAVRLRSGGAAGRSGCLHSTERAAVRMLKRKRSVKNAVAGVILRACTAHIASVLPDATSS